MYEQIVIATDGSDNSLRAVSHGAQLAQLTNARITLLYVVDIDKAKTDVLHAASAESLYLQRRGKLAAAEALLTEAHISYKVEMLNGLPGPAIVDYVNASNADLVIIGSRGLNALQEMVLGSVSHKVMKRVHCPALIIK